MLAWNNQNFYLFSIFSNLVRKNNEPKTNADNSREKRVIPRAERRRFNRQQVRGKAAGDEAGNR